MRTKSLKIHIGLLACLAMSATMVAASTPAAWVLTASTLTYHVSDPFHQVYGVSHAARGKGICQNGACQFMAAAPVRSFQSGDSNRDLHMLQAVRGGRYPMVVVRTSLPAAGLHPGMLRVNLQIQFAGHAHIYKQVPFKVTRQGTGLRLRGTIPATLKDFQIQSPEFLWIKIHNAIPVKVDMTWQPAGQ